MINNFELLKFSFEKLPLGVVVFDNNGKIIHYNSEIVNQSANNVLDEKIGESYFNIGAYIRNGLFLKIRKALKGEFLSFQLKYKNDSGKSRKYFQLMPIFEEEQVSYVIMFIQDITAQAHLAQINSRLNMPKMSIEDIFSKRNKKNLFLNRLLSTLNQTILFVCDHDGTYKYVWADELSIKKTGIQVADFMSDKLDKALFFQQDIKSLSNFYAGQDFRQTVTLKLPAGNFSYDVSVSKMSEGQQTATYYFGVIREITKKYEIERQLNEQILKIEKTNQRLVARELEMIRLKAENKRLKNQL